MTETELEHESRDPCAPPAGFSGLDRSGVRERALC